MAHLGATDWHGIGRAINVAVVGGAPLAALVRDDAVQVFHLATFEAASAADGDLTPERFDAVVTALDPWPGGDGVELATYWQGKGLATVVVSEVRLRALAGPGLLVRPREDGMPVLRHDVQAAVAVAVQTTWMQRPMLDPWADEHPDLPSVVEDIVQQDFAPHLASHGSATASADGRASPAAMATLFDDVELDALVAPPAPRAIPEADIGPRTDEIEAAETITLPDSPLEAARGGSRLLTISALVGAGLLGAAIAQLVL